MDLGDVLKEIREFFEALPQNLLAFCFVAVQIVLLFVSARYVSALISKIMLLVIKRSKKYASVAGRRRFETLCTLAHSITRYLLYFVAVAVSLNILGVGQSVSALITAAGIGGLAIGFGAQSLVKDVVTGIFLLFENQYGVGDFVDLAGVTGTVTAVAIRVTYIKGLKGEELIVPNGAISTVTNYSRGDYAAVVDVSVSKDEDIDRALAVMRDEAELFSTENPELAKPDVLGVVDISETRITMRMCCMVPAPAHFDIERKLRLRVKQRFDKEGLKLPYPHMVLRKDAEGTGRCIRETPRD